MMRMLIRHRDRHRQTAHHPAVWLTVQIEQQNKAVCPLDVCMSSSRPQQYNQLSLHTAGTCTQPSSVTQTGRQGSTDCAVGTSNTGCTVQTTDTNSFGTGFNSNGGGVYALEFANSGIKCGRASP